MNHLSDAVWFPALSGLVLFSCVVITYFHPFLVAREERILSGEQVRAKALELWTRDGDGHGGTPLQTLRAREDLLESIRASLRANAMEGGDFEELRAELDVIDRVYPAPKAEVKFLGFIESKVHYLYFCAYFFLSCHLWRTYTEGREPRRFILFGKHEPRSRRSKAWLSGILACGFIGLSWLSHYCLRADSLMSHGRTVFSFVNRDIGVESHWWMFGRSLILCALIAASWAWWAYRLDGARQRVATWSVDNDPIAPARQRDVLRVLHERSTAVRAAFENWQFHSVFLSAVFVPWMFYYWSLEDTRYYMSNLTMQIVWGITWWLVSAPALHAARSFERYRSDVVTELNSQAADKALLDAVHAESPVSFANAVASGIAAGATYLVPFLHKLVG